MGDTMNNVIHGCVTRTSRNNRSYSKIVSMSCKTSGPYWAIRRQWCHKNKKIVARRLGEDSPLHIGPWGILVDVVHPSNVIWIFIHISLWLLCTIGSRYSCLHLTYYIISNTKIYQNVWDIIYGNTITFSKPPSKPSLQYK